MKKRAVTVLGHATSISLEEEFWNELKLIAHANGQSMNALIGHVDKNRRSKNLSSALRLFVLRSLKKQIP